MSFSFLFSFFSLESKEDHFSDWKSDFTIMPGNCNTLTPHGRFRVQQQGDVLQGGWTMLLSFRVLPISTHQAFGCIYNIYV